jgi:putative sterol carrier protein
MSDTSTAVKEVFAAMPENFNPQAATGMDAVIQYELSGDAEAQYHATIKDGTCTVAEGAHDAPTLTLKMAASDFVDLINGRLDGMSAFMSGKLRIEGDMGIAMKLQSLFRA